MNPLAQPRPLFYEHTDTLMEDPLDNITRLGWTIAGLLLFGIIAGLAIGLKIANENPRYPGCTGYFGIEDKECRWEHASRRLGGGF